MRPTMILSALLPALLLAAHAAPAKLPPITKVGNVTLSQMSMTMPGTGATTMTSASASFYKALGGEGSGGMPADTCTVFSYKAGDTSSIPGVKEAEARAAKIVSLDAGNPLNMTGGGAAYAKLPRTVADKTISYSPETPTLPAAPAALTIDIPGASGANGFPAFKNAALPSAARVALTGPKDLAKITPETTFAWSNPTNDPAARVLFSGTQQVGANTVAFTCSAKDDGSFAFPAAAQKDLVLKGFTSGALQMYGRSASRDLRNGEALLTLSVMSYEMPERR